MKLSHHLTVSAVISVILYAIVKSWSLTISSFLTGVLIDLDHYIDYIIEFRSPFNIKKFFKCFYEERNKKIYFVFHGWEWSIILLLAGWMLQWNYIIIGMIIGYGQHMILDALFNTNWPVMAYSFLWRWKRGFAAESIRPRKNDGTT